MIAVLLIAFLCPTQAYAVTGMENQALIGLQEDIHQAISLVKQSVVSIRAQKRAKTGKQAGLWFESIGSGFIIDSDGHILTNYHVVNDAETIDVSIWPIKGERFAATIVHSDHALDLALLKITTTKALQPALLANSDQLELGDYVLSIGSPFGFDHTVTLGTVSAVNRDLLIEGRTYSNMIQTDAVINEGNSGGPLIDINGKVVGVGTAIYAPDGTYTGLGFAIPINRAKHFFTRITGALTVALTQPAAPANKLPIDINKRRPGDAIHLKITDCTQCHIITTKSVVSTQLALPHPMVGACNNCHIMEAHPPAGKPVTVAQTRPLPLEHPQTVNFNEKFWNHYLPKTILLVLASTILFSMLGVGGGFIYVPILLACGLDFYTASTTSLLMLSAASVSALMIFIRSGLVDWKLIAILEIPTMLGAFTGGMYAYFFNVSLLYVLFAICLFAASFFMIQDEDWLSRQKKSFNFSPYRIMGDKANYVYEIDLALSVPITFAVGFLGGIMGLAGGWLKVPMMVVLFGVPMKVAIACSAIMVPITGISGFMGHQTLGHFEPKVALVLCLVAVIGAQIGSRISIQSKANLLRVLFAGVLSLVGIWMLIRIFFFSQ
nr:TSUP family transporter [Desulfobulbaceae bacterium]